MSNGKTVILMVDDNPTNLMAGKNVLAEKYSVFTAPSAAKMFEILEINKPALILLDIGMPGMSGYEAIRILKQNSETRDIPVIFLTGKNETNSELKGLSLGAFDYIIKPFVPELLLKRIEIQLLVESQKQTLEAQRVALENFNENLQKMVDEKTRKVLELQDAILQIIADLVESRDNVTGGHIERTQRGMRILIESMIRRGLYPEETRGWNIDLLLQSSQLHDVGKIQISDSVLKKPGNLTEEEFDEMKKHTIFGKMIIEKIEGLAKESDFLEYAKIFAISHHEKWDGSGYPYGLKHEEIPLLGRVMAIVDVYDALTSERPYKKAFSHEEAVEIIKESRGIQFDPAITGLFLEEAEKFREC